MSAPAPKTATLFVDDSERNSDLYWKTGFWAGDPFVFAEIDGRTHLLLSDLELGRGKKESQVDEVHSWTALSTAARAKSGAEKVAYEGVIAHFLEERDVTHLEVASRFPLRTADRLRDAGFTALTLSDETESWSAFVAERLAAFRRGRARQVAVHGAELVDALDDFYATVAALYAGGNLGGVRIVARRD